MDKPKDPGLLVFTNEFWGQEGLEMALSHMASSHQEMSVY